VAQQAALAAWLLACGHAAAAAAVPRALLGRGGASAPGEARA